MNETCEREKRNPFAKYVYSTGVHLSTLFLFSERITRPVITFLLFILVIGRKEFFTLSVLYFTEDGFKNLL
jgi:hypothetical protein